MSGEPQQRHDLVVITICSLHRPQFGQTNRLAHSVSGSAVTCDHPFSEPGTNPQISRRSGRRGLRYLSAPGRVARPLGHHLRRLGPHPASLGPCSPATSDYLSRFHPVSLRADLPRSTIIGAQLRENWFACRKPRSIARRTRRDRHERDHGAPRHLLDHGGSSRRASFALQRSLCLVVAAQTTHTERADAERLNKARQFAARPAWLLWGPPLTHPTGVLCHSSSLAIPRRQCQAREGAGAGFPSAPSRPPTALGASW